MLFAVITVSDTSYHDNTYDKSGPSIKEYIKSNFVNPIIITKIVPDEQDKIEAELKHFCDTDVVDIVLTTGGTGLSPRDVTPEATKAVITKEIPAISTAITIESLKITPMAMLSRSVAGVRNNTLIINLPGSEKAALECVDIVKPVLQHAVSLIKNELSKVKSFHSSMNPVCRYHEISDYSKVAFRDRSSPYPMTSITVAFSIIDEVMKGYKYNIEKINIKDSLGKIVAHTLHAVEPLPPFPASVKDGYACLSSDGAGKRFVRAAVTAGEESKEHLSPGECIRINTGAPLPPGADCVVQVEDTKLIAASEDGKIEYEIEVLKAAVPMQDVRPVGHDIQVGDTLVEKYTVIDAAHVGVLAGAGHQYVDIISLPKVALLSTGNELQEPWEQNLKPSHIRDSNRIMLETLLREHGFESIDFGIVTDDANKLCEAIISALKKTDILVCTGGVSMGERDLLKPVLIQNFNAKILFGRVNMKPGKPATLATLQLDGVTKYVFALPGNPVSAYLCCLLFVIRALNPCGDRSRDWPHLYARLATEVTLDSRPEYARAVLRFTSNVDFPTASILGNQCSSRLASACGTSVLVELPSATPGNAVLPAGAVVRVLLTGRVR